MNAMEIATEVSEATHALTSWGYLTTDEGMSIVKSVPPDCCEVRGESNVDHFKRAVYSFKQRWQKYKLSGDDELDDDVAALMKRRFCSCSDFEPAVARNAGLRRWDSKRLTWGGDVRVGSLSWSDAQAFVVAETLRVCGMELVITGVGRVNISSRDGFIDGPGGTVGQAFLPGFPSRAASETLGQEYDRAETRMPFGTWKLVVLHETGHSLGLGHDNSPSVAVMDPFVNSNLTGWMPPDVRELTARYDEPGTAPPPTEPPGPEPPGPGPDPPRWCPPGRRQLIRDGLQLLRELGV